MSEVLAHANIYTEGDKFRTTAYTLQDKIKVNIYDDLWIDFVELGL